MYGYFAKRVGVFITIISTVSWRFLQVAWNVSEVPNSKYHNLFFILLLNFSGCRSRIIWNLWHIDASWKRIELYIFWKLRGLIINRINFRGSNYQSINQSITYHTYREIIIDYVTRNLVPFFFFTLIWRTKFYLPFVHHDSLTSWNLV